MEWIKYLSTFFVLLVIGLLVFYFFIPTNSVNYVLEESQGSNFSLSQTTNDSFQFYQNMRYPDYKISYRIIGCPIGKKDEMKRAIEYIQNKTILKFYEVVDSEEISVTCDNTLKLEGSAFIAGEGGTTNVTKTNNFNVIDNGQVLLLRETQCAEPIVAAHELMHSLGFQHSTNPSNLMYPTVDCRQTIGDDTVNYINKLYSYPSFSDLSFENVSATIKGKYLDGNFIIRNNGLIKSENSTVIVYSGNSVVKKISLGGINVGYGIEIMFENQWSPELSSDESLRFVIDAKFNELDKSNNEVVLNEKK
ncbi:MAG: matrixin family metalloprotease [Nanoarchaeota archaeon]